MLNVLGQHVEAAETYVTENPSAHLHLYGKLEAKHNRRMGLWLCLVIYLIRLRNSGKGLIFLKNSMPLKYFWNQKIIEDLK